MEETAASTTPSFQERLAAWDRELMRIDENGLWAPPDSGRNAPGQWLRRRRRFEGLSQQDLAARSGLAQTGVSRVERGLDCRWSTLELLARSLGCEPVFRLRPLEPSRPPSRWRPGPGRRRGR